MVLQKKTDTVIALVMVDSVTNYVGCVPVRAKSQTDLMVRELLQFTQTLGHAECTYLCDNEPAARQLQRMAVRARLALGLPTKDKNPAAYSHGNSLCENTIQRGSSCTGYRTSCQLFWIPIMDFGVGQCDTAHGF